MFFVFFFGWAVGTDLNVTRAKKKKKRRNKAFQIIGGSLKKIRRELCIRGDTLTFDYPTVVRVCVYLLLYSNYIPIWCSSLFSSPSKGDCNHPIYVAIFYSAYYLTQEERTCKPKKRTKRKKKTNNDCRIHNYTYTYISHGHWCRCTPSLSNFSLSVWLFNYKSITSRSKMNQSSNPNLSIRRTKTEH